jgi:hypothetical protein
MIKTVDPLLRVKGRHEWNFYFISFFILKSNIILVLITDLVQIIVITKIMFSPPTKALI